MVILHLFFKHLPSFLLNRTHFLILILLLSLVMPRFLVAADFPQESDDLANRNYETIGQKIQIRRIQQGISDQKEMVQDNKQKEHEILAELEDMDTKMREQQQKVESLDKKISDQQQIISQLDIELQALHTSKADIQEHLKKRIGAYYKMGKVGLLNVVFSTKTLPDLLVFHDSFQLLIVHDEEVLRDFHQKITRIEKAQKANELEKSVLVDFKLQALQEKDEVQNLIKNKEELLQHVRSQQKLHSKAIKELEIAAANLTASIAAEPSPEEKENLRFQQAKGSYLPPVEGKVISLFNQETTNALGVTKKSQGIAINAQDGAAVQAIAAGTVIFAGYLRGYGNTVVVHHGTNYYSVLSRLEQIDCKKGDKVKAKSIIGHAGDTATIMDPGVYFEIRKEKEPLDPLSWLDNKRISIASPPSTQ